MGPGKKILQFLLPRLQDILFVAILGGSFLLGPRMLSVDSDLGRHLAFGRYILVTGKIPTTDLFSHTRPGAERPPYEWLTQLIFALLDRIAGLDAVILLVCLVIALTFSFVYGQAARRSGLPVLSLLLTVLAVAASSLHWLPRPHVVTFLFLAILLERLESVRLGEHVPLWQFPALMLLWANTHGGFVFGFLAWMAYLAGWCWDKWINKSGPATGSGTRLLSGSLLAGVASVLTPDGWENWKAVLSNHSQYILSRTVETMPPDFHQTSTWPFLLLGLLSIFRFLLIWKKAQASHVFLLAGFAGAGLIMARNIPLFAVAAPPILSLWVCEALQKGKIMSLWLIVEKRIEELQRLLSGGFWPVLFGWGLVLFIGGRQLAQKGTLMQFNRNVFPVQAVDWLEANPQSGLMFNEFNWGGYLLYRLWPEQKVFLDSQTDFYGEALVKEYEQAITASPGWDEVLHRYNVTWVIIPRTTRLASALQNSHDWEMLYQDPITIILKKADQ
jgi:hypothetical protein